MAGMSIDRQKLQELLRDFRTLTGICISFWYHGDEWSVIGDTVYASPFCALLRQNEALTTSIRMDDYRIAPAAEGCFDLFFIATK